MFIIFFCLLFIHVCCRVEKSSLQEACEQLTGLADFDACVTTARVSCASRASTELATDDKCKQLLFDIKHSNCFARTLELCAEAAFERRLVAAVVVNNNNNNATAPINAFTMSNGAVNLTDGRQVIIVCISIAVMWYLLIEE
jgi:hypothetical protein